MKPARISYQVEMMNEKLYPDVLTTAYKLSLFQLLHIFLFKYVLAS